MQPEIKRGKLLMDLAREAATFARFYKERRAGYERMYTERYDAIECLQLGASGVLNT